MNEYQVWRARLFAHVREELEVDRDKLLGKIRDYCRMYSHWGFDTALMHIAKEKGVDTDDLWREYVELVNWLD